MPQIDFARWAAYGILGALVLTFAVGFGYKWGVQQLYEAQAEAATKGARVMKVRQVVTEKVVVKYLKAATVTQTVKEVIEKKVVVYAEKNPGSCLDGEWGRLHDAAAKNIISDAAGEPDAARGAPTAAAALTTVTENYAKHNACVDRLDALQEWVRNQQAVKEE